MYQHNIFLANSYKLGKRVALDVVLHSTTENNVEKHQQKLENFSLKLYNALGDEAAITTHSIYTNSENWKSVVEKDSFFDDIYITKNLDEFIEIVRENNDLTVFDLKLLIYLLLSKNIPIFINREEIFNKTLLSYNEKFNKPLYNSNLNNKTIPSDDELNSLSNVIVDKVLSSPNGSQKFKFILEKLHDYTRSPLFL